jgi:hypothetical protein
MNMNKFKPIYLFILILIASTLACSISGISKQAQSVEQTAQAIKTDVGGIVSAGDALLNTAQALETQHPGILETVKAFPTQGAPMISTIQAVATNNPGLVKTAQAFIEQEIPTGEAPLDIPIYNRDQAQNYFGSSQYIFYITPSDYAQILDFYKTQMVSNGWQYLESDSQEYANAAQLNYFKDNRIATINLSFNPLNNTTVVVISMGS